MTLATLPAALRQCKELSLSPIGATILIDIHQSPFILTVGDAIIGTGAPHSTALRHIHILANDGFISIHKANDDGRRLYLKLTDKGLAVVA